MNKCHFAGRLTRNPEIRYTNSENPMAIANYTMAIDRKHKRADEPQADFLNFVGYGSTAEFAEKYLKKGIKMIVAARCQTRNYTNNSGQKVYVTEFIIEDQEFAESKRSQQQDTIPTDSEGFMQIPEGPDDGLPFN